MCGRSGPKSICFGTCFPKIFPKSPGLSPYPAICGLPGLCISLCSFFSFSYHRDLSWAPCTLTCACGQHYTRCIPCWPRHKSRDLADLANGNTRTPVDSLSHVCRNPAGWTLRTMNFRRSLACLPRPFPSESADVRASPKIPPSLLPSSLRQDQTKSSLRSSIL